MSTKFHKLWQPGEDRDLLRLVLEDKTDAEIAVYLNRTLSGGGVSPGGALPRDQGSPGALGTPGDPARLVQGLARREAAATSADQCLGEDRMEGRKDDAGKTRWDLVPWGVMDEVARVLTKGAAKYGDDNWQDVADGRSRYFAASLRHIFAWANGANEDPETGESHLAHAICCLLFLRGLEKSDE